MLRVAELGRSGKGLDLSRLFVREEMLVWVLLLRLLSVLLVEGRSVVAKLMPESVRRSLRRNSLLWGSNVSVPLMSTHSSMIPLAARRYLSTTSRTTAHPFASVGRSPWCSRFFRTDLPFLSTAIMYRKKACRCDARMTEVSWGVGGAAVVGG